MVVQIIPENERDWAAKRKRKRISIPVVWCESPPFEVETQMGEIFLQFKGRQGKTSDCPKSGQLPNFSNMVSLASLRFVPSLFLPLPRREQRQ